VRGGILRIVRKICILLVPYDSGRHRERNGLGPHHLVAAIEPLLTRLGHQVRVEEITLPPGTFVAEISSMFALSREIARRVRQLRDENWRPLVLSGNCDASLGTVSGCRNESTSVVWFDAHGEATTPETTTSGFLDGMGISMLTDQCWPQLTRTVPGYQPLPGDRILLVGARDVEPAEQALLERLCVRRVPHPDDVFDAYAAMRLQGDDVYLHLDLDVLDPSAATANQWPTPGGPSVADMVRGVAAVSRLSSIGAIGLASFDPNADRDGRALQAALAILEAALHPPSIDHN
jgi:arginase